MTPFIRKLWPHEARLFGAHLLRLGPQARRMRFGAPVNEERLRLYARDAFTFDAIVLGYFADGLMRGSAELHPLRHSRPAEAEAAFAIEDDWQGHGIGQALMARILTLAQNRGMERLHLFCLQENRRMLHLARRFDAALTYETGEVDALVRPGSASPFSFLDEAFDDAEGALRMALRV
ncbi:GNAT family N-acetyltransferase [Afifella pfennigii]|uniref:GNAT family N-acetyltransferase n=1 Tax=Afifella pfennigii TaxID=209897 RepID=UPI000690FBAC|nr:GNAT family N-acetyltransferase [Afifella pfennigii]